MPETSGSDLILRKGTQVKIGILAALRGCFKVHRSKIMRQNRDEKYSLSTISERVCFGIKVGNTGNTPHRGLAPDPNGSDLVLNNRNITAHYSTDRSGF